MAREARLQVGAVAGFTKTDAYPKPSVLVMNFLVKDDDKVDKFHASTQARKLEMQKHLVKLAVEWEQQRPVMIDFIIKYLSADSYEKLA